MQLSKVIEKMQAIQKNLQEDPEISDKDPEVYFVPNVAHRVDHIYICKHLNDEYYNTIFIGSDW